MAWGRAPNDPLRAGACEAESGLRSGCRPVERIGEPEHIFAGGGGRSKGDQEDKMRALVYDLR